MALAVNLLGESRREWTQAMRAEFEVARAEGDGLAFATGCLIAAWGEMPKHPEGRHVLANYALALGLLIPMAAFQFASAFGFASTMEGPVSEGIFLPRAAPNPFVSYPQVSALPCLLVLWLLLGLGHLRLAWVLVERDWARVIKTSAMIGATTVTLIMFMGTLLLDLTSVVLQSVAMAVELTALVAAARRHERLSYAVPHRPVR
jgi:hypothetical protein